MSSDKVSLLCALLHKGSGTDQDKRQASENDPEFIADPVKWLK